MGCSHILGPMSMNICILYPENIFIQTYFEMKAAFCMILVVTKNFFIPGFRLFWESLRSMYFFFIWKLFSDILSATYFG